MGVEGLGVASVGMKPKSRALRIQRARSLASSSGVRVPGRPGCSVGIAKSSLFVCWLVVVSSAGELVKAYPMDADRDRRMRPVSNEVSETPDCRGLFGKFLNDRGLCSKVPNDDFLG